VKAAMGPGSRWRTGGKLKPAAESRFGDDSAAEIVEVLGAASGAWVRAARSMRAPRSRSTARCPSPPYIKREPTAQISERYQTVYARTTAAVAAPTAGLHFTTELLARIHEQRTLVTAVDLHVGPGTLQAGGDEAPTSTRCIRGVRDLAGAAN